MKKFHNWLLTSIAVVLLAITSTLFTQAQQTAEGDIKLEIQAGNSCCVYGTSVAFGEKDISFGITEFSGDFLSYHGTTSWGCRDLLGTETGRAMYIEMSGDMENQNGNKINSGNVKISFDDTTLVGGDCQYTVNSGIDVSLNTGVTLVEKAEIEGNYGKICELGTTNVELKVVTNTGQAPGNYVGTLVITLPPFANNTCDGELIGTFYDAETAGLSYVGNMGSVGVTSNSGSFSYKAGEEITFKIGNVTLGNPVIPAANGSVFVTDLFDLARTEITDANVIEVGRLLQGLDTDNNPENGIVIESSVASQFTENNNVTALDVSAKLTALSKPIKTAKQVVQHLENTAEEKLSEDVNIGYSSVQTIPGYSKVKIDSGFNIYVGGVFDTGWEGGMVSFGSTELYNNGQYKDIYVGKKDMNGNWLWATKGGGSDADSLNDITIDNQGNTYVVGSYKGTGEFGSFSLYSQYDGPFVAKTNDNGDWLWVATGGYAIGRVAADNSGNIYVGGTYYSTGVFGTIILPSEGEYVFNSFIGKIDTNGNWIRVKKATGQDIYGIKPDNQGNIHIAGMLNDQIYISKVNSEGDQIRMTQTVGNYQGSSIYPISLAVDNQGNSYVGGTFYGQIVFGSLMLSGVSEYNNEFIAKVDSNGNWVKATDLFGKNIEIDNLGNLYAVNSFYGTKTIGDIQVTNRWTDEPYNSVVSYVAKIDNDFNIISADTLEGITVSSLIVDKLNNLYICGPYEGELSFSEESFLGGSSWYYYMNSYMIYKKPNRDKESTLLYTTTPPERAE